MDRREAERYLKVSMADSPAMFLKALRNVAEANRMAKVAAEAGVSREGLYNTLSEGGNPTFATLTSVLNAVGIELTVKLKDPFVGTTGPVDPRTRIISASLSAQESMGGPADVSTPLDATNLTIHATGVGAEQITSLIAAPGNSQLAQAA